ncbi:unnamed protein product [Rotaria sp. Silwood1]|nr:unnamed protein product [Rotaria sp. Silwood1]
MDSHRVHVSVCKGSTTSRRSAKKRRSTFRCYNELTPLTEQDYHQIHFTQPYIHATFSNAREMNVLETYFALKYKFMNASELPAIRVFKADEKLWSVDNRRLWAMKHANRFHCEGPYSREHDSRRFNEVVIKRRSLRDGSGIHVQFHSDASVMCCIMAFNQGLLDRHMAEIHFKTSLENIRFLADYIIPDYFVCNRGSLYDRLRDKCLAVKRSMAQLYLRPNEEQQKMFELFK